MAKARDAVTKVHDFIVREQIRSFRFAKGLAATCAAIMSGSNRELRLLILDYADQMDGIDPTSRQAQEIFDSFYTQLDNLRSPVWQQIYTETATQLQEMGMSAADKFVAAVDTALPIVVILAALGAKQVVSLVDNLPIRGRTLRQWFDRQQRAEIDTIAVTTRSAVQTGMSAAQTVRSVIGSKAQGIAGIISRSVRDVGGIINTAVNAVGNAVRSTVMTINDEVFGYVRFSAVLDNRTTWMCAHNDGRTGRLDASGLFFVANDGLEPRNVPVPPLHFGCRSTVHPEFQSSLWQRPFKADSAALEKDLRSLYNERQKGGYNGSYEAFKDSEMAKRGLIGELPQTVTFDQFLRRQDAAFQNEYLGPTRAAMYRDNPEMTISNFVASDLSTITLKQLKE